MKTTDFFLGVPEGERTHDGYMFKRRESDEPLTPQDLENMAPHTIFQWGETFIEHPWFNDAKKTLIHGTHHTKVHYVVLRGGIADFKIYHSLDANLEHADYLDGDDHLKRPLVDVLRHGASMHRPEVIRRIVPCTDEAFEMYRH